MGVFFMNFQKIFGTYFDVLQDFLKVHKNTGENMFAKYLSSDGCFIKTILLTMIITTMLSVS